MLTVACLRTLPAAALGLVGTLLLACLARMPWRWFLARLAVIGLLLLAFVVPLPWFANFSFAGVVLCKALALFTLAAALLVAAPLEVSLKAMRALYVPALLVHLTLLSYRYLFVLGDELARLRVALRVRGFRNRPDLRSYRTVAAAAGTLLVRGYERGERVSAAMRCRGFDGRFRALAEFRTRWQDVIVFAVVAGASVGLLSFDWHWRS